MYYTCYATSWSCWAGFWFCCFFSFSVCIWVLGSLLTIDIGDTLVCVWLGLLLLFPFPCKIFPYPITRRSHSIRFILPPIVKKLCFIIPAVSLHLFGCSCRILLRLVGCILGWILLGEIWGKTLCWLHSHVCSCIILNEIVVPIAFFKTGGERVTIRLCLEISLFSSKLFEWISTLHLNFTLQLLW